MGNFAENLNLGNRFRPPPENLEKTFVFFLNIPVLGLKLYLFPIKNKIKQTKQNKQTKNKK